MTNPVIIIGSGLAGYTLAREFRKYDQETPLHIVTSSHGNFYSKPLLSTALTNKRSAADLAVKSADMMCDELNASITTETIVTEVNAQNNTITMNDVTLPYSQLVFACGADVISAPVLGDAVADICSVNNLQDYEQFRDVIADKKHVTVFGAGLVGCEFANDLITTGHDVELVAPSAYPLDALLPREVGDALRQAFEEAGATWHLGQLATKVDHLDGRYNVSLSEDKQIQTDVVLSAIGLRPHTRLAETAGARIGRGITVNHYLQTSVDNIYALGDCAEVNGLVMLYVAPILHCARVLAKTLAGEKTAVKYPAMPVAIKTPLCPIVVSTPPRDLQGQWHIEGQGKNVKATFVDVAENLRGFALTGTMVKERMALTKQLPPIFE